MRGFKNCEMENILVLFKRMKKVTFDLDMLKVIEIHNFGRISSLFNTKGLKQ